jgi:hypothetical protein
MEMWKRLSLEYRNDQYLPLAMLSRTRALVRLATSLYVFWNTKAFCGPFAQRHVVRICARIGSIQLGPLKPKADHPFPLAAAHAGNSFKADAQLSPHHPTRRWKASGQ